MSQRLRIRDAQLYRLSIPMRLRFEHAAAARDAADPIIVGLSAASPYAQMVGYGETLARPYVTGETSDSVVADLQQLFVPRLTEFKPDSFSAALEFIESLPTQIEGRVITAARCAFELALLDLCGKVFGRRLTDIAGWMGLPGFGPPGAVAAARYSGIVIGETQPKLAWFLRWQRWYGLRDFKLKVGVNGWEQKLAWASKMLKPAIDRGEVTVRADANASWSLSEAHDAAELLDSHAVCVLEQPLSDTHDADLLWLSEQTKCALAVDESLLTIDDAQRLISSGGIRLFNIRLAKNGGLLPSLRLARLALSAGIDVQLGCLVGETSILTAAGLAFLEAVPKVRFVEGAFGRFLLRHDVTRKSLRFGVGGKLSPRKEPGLGVHVDTNKLQRFSTEKPRVIHL